MGQIVRPETLVFNPNQTSCNYPKEDNLNTLKHGERLKFNNDMYVLLYTADKFHSTLCMSSKSVVP